MHFTSGYITVKWVGDVGTANVCHWGVLLVTCTRSQKTAITWKLKLNKKITLSFPWTGLHASLGEDHCWNMLTVIFSVNLNIPLLLWAWGCRQKPPPCVLERAVQAASTTLPGMMDGLAHCPCFCRIAWVGQVCLHTLYIKGSTSRKFEDNSTPVQRKCGPKPCSQLGCDSGAHWPEPYSSTKTASSSKANSLLLNFGRFHWCWACHGLMSQTSARSTGLLLLQVPTAKD